MEKIITKLYRNPREAERAMSKLISEGYQEEGNIGTLMLSKEGKEGFSSGTKVVTLPSVGVISATGRLASAISPVDAASGEELTPLLAKALSISLEEAEYYSFSLSVGSVLVSVHTEEDKAQRARQLLNEAESIPQTVETQANSPGFSVTERMSTTNPIDAPMTGDFRKY